MHVVQQHKACLQKQFKTQKWFQTLFRVVTTTLGTNRYIGGHSEEVLYKSVNSQITILEKCHRTPTGWLVVVIAACKSKNIKTHIVKDINLLSVNVGIFENHIYGAIWRKQLWRLSDAVYIQPEIINLQNHFWWQAGRVTTIVQTTVPLKLGGKTNFCSTHNLQMGTYQTNV